MPTRHPPLKSALEWGTVTPELLEASTSAVGQLESTQREKTQIPQALGWRPCLGLS